MSHLSMAPGMTATRPSRALTYDLWLTAWETALSALAIAKQTRALSANEAAAHSAVITAERNLVAKHFAQLLGHEHRHMSAP